MRYGENPHQHGARYRIAGQHSWWDEVVQHGGKELSYLNVFDADAAWRLVHELPVPGTDEVAVAIIKHANPCGAAVHADLAEAYARALDCDPLSAFGGVVAVGGRVTEAVAEQIAAGPQADVILAASFDEGALALLSSKRKATRLLSGPDPEPIVRQVRTLGSSVLVQDADRFLVDPADWTVATGARPSDAQWRDLVMAWKVCARTTSNAIAVVSDRQAVGVGAGQQSRVVAAELAVTKAGDRARGGAAASDALLSLPRRTRGARRRRGRRGRPTGRVDPRRRGGGRSGASRHRRGDGRRRAPLPPLTASLLDGELARRLRADPCRDHRPGRPAARGRRHRGARHRARRGRRTLCSLRGDEARRLRRGRDATRSTSTCRPTRARHSSTRSWPDSTPIRPCTRISCSSRCPQGLDEERTLLAVDPDKDVDGLHPVNLGRLVMGTPGPLPCTPAGIVELLAANDVPVEGKHVVIIGRGLTIGRPLALLLALKRPGCNAAVTVVHTGVEDLAGLVHQADVVVAAAGRAGLVTADMVKPGAAVVGAGTSWEGKKLLSDVDEGVAEVAGWITPRIGGVGPMTRAMLLRNAVRAAERSA